MEKWFALVEGQVRGPFLKDDLESQLKGWPGALIWGRGMSEWLSAERWHESLLELNKQNSLHNQKLERQWRLLIDGQELKPMSHDEMIRLLRNKTDLTHVRIWTEGYSDWKDIYQIHKIMDELGVSRRTHPRVPVMGSMNCDGPNGQFTGRLLSISEGGLGATEGPQAKIGDKLKVVIKSPNLNSYIHATVEVVYVGPNGYFGMKFMGLQTESRSLIIEYIRKFSENSQPGVR